MKGGRKSNRSLPKAPTGVQGLDEITGGGFPRGRPTLVCGSARAGKAQHLWQRELQQLLHLFVRCEDTISVAEHGAS